MRRHLPKTAQVEACSAKFHSEDSLNERHSAAFEGSSDALSAGAGLTQVLADGTNTYLYGLSRIGEKQPGGWQYHIPDALGSVRQLTDASAAVTLAQSYEPFGSALSSSGSASTVFQFTGEQLDRTGLVYLRARYYASEQGRFVSRDVWDGDDFLPLSQSKWIYARSNPINWIDPSGEFWCRPEPRCSKWVISALGRLSFTGAAGGSASRYIFDVFDWVNSSPLDLGIVFRPMAGGWSPLMHLILLDEKFLLKIPASEYHIALFSHEIAHQIQGVQRYSVYGEAQAYILQGMVLREMKKHVPLFIDEVSDLAYDPDTPGFTTRDLDRLCRVRRTLLGAFDNSWYRSEPLVLNWIVFPQWYTACKCSGLP